MPEQKPSSCSCSRSNSQRILIRWASSSLPCFSNHAIRSPSSSRMDSIARLTFSCGVANCLLGKMFTAVNDSMLSPVSGSNRVNRSISSPKNSMRRASSV